MRDIEQNSNKDGQKVERRPRGVREASERLGMKM